MTELVSEPSADAHSRDGRRISRAVVYALLPALIMSVALAAAFFKWEDAAVRNGALWRSESVQAAREGTVALLSYKPDTVEKDLGSALSRLTGDFQKTYASLTRDVVVPGATRGKVSAVASVPAAASVSATENDAVVIVFVNQSSVVGAGAPNDTASTVRVTLKKVADKWLISSFDPI